VDTDSELGGWGWTRQLPVGPRGRSSPGSVRAEIRGLVEPPIRHRRDLAPAGVGELGRTLPEVSTAMSSVQRAPTTAVLTGGVADTVQTLSGDGLIDVAMRPAPPPIMASRLDRRPWWPRR